MKLIKRKIYLDEFVSRTNESWGKINNKEFNIKLFIEQDSDDMGIFTDMSFIPKNNSTPNYEPLISKLQVLGLEFSFMSGNTFNVSENGYEPFTRFPFKVHSDYLISGDVISGLTEDRLDMVTSYDNNLKYKPLFDIDNGLYIGYDGEYYNGTTRVIDNVNNLNPISYSEDTDINDVLGSSTQLNGIFYTTFMGTDRVIIKPDGSEIVIPKTIMIFKAQGINETNSSLKAIIKEEYLFGITNSPEVKNDVFIDRGRNTIMQNHLQLGEITNLSDLINYGNGFYNIIK